MEEPDFSNKVGKLPADEALWRKFRDAFVAALEYARVYSLNGRYISDKSSCVELTWHANGMPRLWNTSLNCGKDYSSVFRPNWSAALGGDEDEKPNFDELTSFFRSHEPIANFFPDSLLESGVGVLLHGAVDTYVHAYGFEFHENKVLEVFGPIEETLLLRQRRGALWIPILWQVFETDNFLLAANVNIRRIPDELHLTRGFRWNGSNENLLVESGATHAFVIDGVSLPNQDFFRAAAWGSIEEELPTADVDLLFACLRIAAHAETGYAQLLFIPTNWSYSFNAVFNSVRRVDRKRYPRSFDNGVWASESLPALTADQLRLSSELFARLSSLERTGTRMGLAIRRLNQAFLRDDEHDSILDVTIGMEALLSDGSEEITHKLALRLAALLKFAQIGKIPAHQLFKEAKAIYKFRSAVIHGDINAVEKRAHITRHDQEKVSTVFVALEHFRNLLCAIAFNADFLKVELIDTRLLLGCLES